MIKIKKFISIVMVILLLPSVSAFADEYDDYTLTIPLLHRYHRSNSGDIYVDRSYAANATENEQYPFNDANLYNEGPQFEFNLDTALYKIEPDKIKSAKLNFYAFSGKSASQTFTLDAYTNTTLMPEDLGTLGVANKITDSDVKAALESVFGSMTDITLSHTVNNLSKSSLNPSLVSIELKDTVVFETDKHLILNVKTSDGKNTYLVGGEEFLPYLEITIDNEASRIEAAQEAVEALSVFENEGSINSENIGNLESGIADAKQKIARLREGEVKKDLTNIVIGMEARMNAFYITYMRETFDSTDGADISSALRFALDFEQEKDYFVKAESFITDSCGEATAKITVGDTVVWIKSDGIYINDEKTADAISGENSLVLKLSGKPSKNLEFFINGISVTKKENQNLNTVSEISAQSTNKEAILIKGITVETCPAGFGHEAEIALSELDKSIKNTESKLSDISDMYSQVYSAAAAMSESIFSEQIKCGADNLMFPYLVGKRKSADEEKNYNMLVKINSEWDKILDSSLKLEEQTRIKAILSGYDEIVPVVKEVGIIQLSKNLFKASYIVEDSIIREQSPPLIQWIIDGDCISQNEDTFDASSYEGFCVTLLVTPLNNKGYSGKSGSASIVVPSEDDDFTKKVLVNRRYVRSVDLDTGELTGNIYLNREYTSNGVRFYVFNDGGYYPEGIFLEFDPEDTPLESLKSAKLVINCAGKESYINLNGYVNTNSIPAEIKTVNSSVAADSGVLELLHETFNNMNRVNIRSDKKIDKDATAKNPSMLEFDLLQEGGEGNNKFSFETGKDIVLNISTPEGIKDIMLALSDDCLPYLLLDVDMEPTRVANAKKAVDNILPYISEQEISAENFETVVNMLKIAQNKVSRIAASELKNEFLSVIGTVEKKKNMFLIENSRQQLQSVDKKNIMASFDKPVELTENDLFVKVDFDIHKPMAEDEIVKINIGDKINAIINCGGIYLQGQKIAELPTGNAEIMLRNSVNGKEPYVELFLNAEPIERINAQDLGKVNSVVVTNNTEESVTTNSMCVEVCPPNYGNLVYESVCQLKKSLSESESTDKAVGIYNEINDALDGMGDSLYFKLQSEKFNNIITEYATETLNKQIAERNYSGFISYKGFIENIKNDEIKESLLIKYSNIEDEFDKLTPEIPYAGIEEAEDNVLKAVYTVNDTVGNGKKSKEGKIIVALEWILDTGDVVGTDEKIDISGYKGHKIILSVRPINNKNFMGEATKSIEFFVKTDYFQPSQGGSGGGGGGKVYDAVYTQGTSKPNANPAANTTGFNDISSSWAKNEIETLKSKNIVNGDKNGNYNPENNITRAEFIAILDRAGKIPEQSADVEFSDVNDNDWFYQNVKKAAGSGIITGSGGAFYPNNTITRQEMALILSRIMAGEPNSDITQIKDYNDIGEWAKEGVRRIYALSIMKGDPDGNFRPLDMVTRAEAAAVICRII